MCVCVCVCVFVSMHVCIYAYIKVRARAGWALPTLGTPGAGGAMEVEGMVPFWMDPGGGRGGAVPNGLFLDGIMVLTGPNTAGKSTVMRSVCAVSLLGNCGLAVPASRAAVPYQVP